MRRGAATLALLGGLVGLLAGCGGAQPVAGPLAAATAPAAEPPLIAGKASYYARHFAGRRMANGQRFDPNSDSAAHRTLPFGTVLRVTNPANGRSALVVVRDRGPFGHGRVLDVSPRVAGDLGMKAAGVAHVEARVAGEELVEVAEAPE